VVALGLPNDCIDRGPIRVFPPTLKLSWVVGVTRMDGIGVVVQFVPDEDPRFRIV
jgi:hypothetical protein